MYRIPTTICLVIKVHQKKEIFHGPRMLKYRDTISMHRIRETIDA